MWAPQLGLARIASPTTAPPGPVRAEDVFRSRYPSATKASSAPAQNFTIQNNDGSPTGKVYSTRDGKFTVDGQPIASLYDHTTQRAVETGSATATPGLTEDVAKQRLAILANELRSRAPTPEEQFTIQTLAPIAYKASRVEEDSTTRPGMKDIKYVRTEEIPPVVADMMGRAGMLKAAAAPAVAPSAGPAMPPVLPPDLGGPPATVTTPAVPPIVSPNAERVVGEVPGDPAKIRDDVVSRPRTINTCNSIPTTIRSSKQLPSRPPTPPTSTSSTVSPRYSIPVRRCAKAS